MAILVFTTVSGIRLMESMPHSTRNSANSGKSLGALAANPDFPASFLGHLDHLRHKPFHRIISFVIKMGNQGRIPVKAQSELGQVVGPYGETVQKYQRTGPRRSRCSESRT